jgi:hypothetical protein
LYTVSVINVAGCSATSSVNIIIDNLPVAPVLAIPLAACASTTLNAGLYPEGTSFTWTSTISNTVLGNGQTVTITQTDSVTVTLTNSCGTSTSNSVPVEILLVPTVDLGPAQSSCVTPITLDAGIQDAGSTYAWFNGSSPIANETNQTYLATVTGNYTATVTNVAGCSTSSSVQVTIEKNSDEGDFVYHIKNVDKNGFEIVFNAVQGQSSTAGTKIGTVKVHYFAMAGSN